MLTRGRIFGWVIKHLIPILLAFFLWEWLVSIIPVGWNSSFLSFLSFLVLIVLIFGFAFAQDIIIENLIHLIDTKGKKEQSDYIASFYDEYLEELAKEREGDPTD